MPRRRVGRRTATSSSCRIAGVRLWDGRGAPDALLAALLAMPWWLVEPPMWENPCENHGKTQWNMMENAMRPWFKSWNWFRRTSEGNSSWWFEEGLVLFSCRYSKSTQWQAKMHDGPFKKTIPQSGWVSTKVTKDYNFCGSNGIPIFELYKVLFPQSCLLVANQFTIVILLMISTINQHTQPRHLTYLSAINQHVFSVIPSHFHQCVAPIQKYTYSCGPKY